MASPRTLRPGLTGQDQDGRTRAVPARALTPGPLRAVFGDLLGRSPFAAERLAWAGHGLDAFLTETLGSDAFWAHWWEEQLYYLLLVDSFRPETKRTLGTPGDLAAGRSDVRDALHRAALTPTFDLRNPGADTFVTVIMEQFCGLAVDTQRSELEAGKTAYDGGPARFLGKMAENQSDVIRIAVESKQATRHFLRREYLRLLRVEPDKKQLTKDVRTVYKNPRAFLDVLRAWLISDTYQARLKLRFPKTNRLYIRSLFVDLGDQLPQEVELESMRTALDGLADPRPLRSVLTRMLLGSEKAQVPARKSIADPTRWIAECFQRFLGRDAEQEELRVYATAFHQPDCKPSTILYALLTHPDYHQL
ncbi:MAG: hypothetical protein ACI8QC_002820 [Planctomycetota bacterium]|jgi:hypothetical protein